MAVSWRAKGADRALFWRQVKRLALPAVATLALAAAASAYALARIVEQSRPELALSIMPSLAPALTAKADSIIAGNQRGERAKFLESRALAERALIASPLNAPALRVVAATGPQTAAYSRRLVVTALRVTRRDLGTQLLAIELNVASNDIPATLRHYDQALSVRPSAGAALYPVLLSATDAPQVRPEVRRMVSRGQEWLPSLISWTLENPEHLRRLARLVDAFPATSEALSPGYGQALVEALAARGELPAAFAVHRAYARGRAVRGFSGGFTYQPIDWTAADGYETGSEYVDSPVPNVRFFAEPGAEGVFLQRLAALRPGRYRIALAVRKQDNARGTLSMILSCRDSRDERVFHRAQARLANGRFVQEFAVPQGCAYQWLRFSVGAGEAPVAAELTGIALEPVA